MTDKDDLEARVKLQRMETLSDNHYVLRRAHFDFRRRDGSWQAQARESYDRGNGAAVLPLDRRHGLVVLIRQFRWPAFEAGYRRLLTETIAGSLDGDTPEVCVIKEAQEEAGIAISNLRHAFTCFMSPGAVTEQVHLFVADYDSTAPRGNGGGEVAEGEDIEVLELPLAEALAQAERGDICDAKTVLLLQWAALNPK